MPGKGARRRLRNQRRAQEAKQSLHGGGGPSYRMTVHHGGKDDLAQADKRLSKRERFILEFQNKQKGGDNGDGAQDAKKKASAGGKGAAAAKSEGDAKLKAKNDGNKKAAGAGAGQQGGDGKKRKKPEKEPRGATIKSVAQDGKVTLESKQQRMKRRKKGYVHLPILSLPPSLSPLFR